MKKNKLVLMFLLFATLVLEILPYGAVCNFATPEETIRRTYSYFDLTPYGYGNVSPFLTALCTVVLILLAAVSLFREGRGLVRAIRLLSIFALILSFCPLFFGIRYYSVTAGLISASLLLICFFNLQLKP